MVAPCLWLISYELHVLQLREKKILERWVRAWHTSWVIVFLQIATIGQFVLLPTYCYSIYTREEIHNLLSKLSATTLGSSIVRSIIVLNAILFVQLWLLIGTSKFCTPSNFVNSLEMTYFALFIEQGLFAHKAPNVDNSSLESIHSTHNL